MSHKVARGPATDHRVVGSYLLQCTCVISWSFRSLQQKRESFVFLISHTFTKESLPQEAKAYSVEGENCTPYCTPWWHWSWWLGIFAWLRVSQNAVRPASSQDRKIDSWNLLKLRSSTYFWWKELKLERGLTVLPLFYFLLMSQRPIFPS